MTGLGAYAFHSFVPSLSIHLFLINAHVFQALFLLLLFDVQNSLINSLKNYCEPFIFLKGGRSRFYVEQNVF